MAMRARLAAYRVCLTEDAVSRYEHRTDGDLRLWVGAHGGTVTSNGGWQGCKGCRPSEHGCCGRGRRRAGGRGGRGLCAGSCIRGWDGARTCGGANAACTAKCQADALAAQLPARHGGTRRAAAEWHEGHSQPFTGHRTGSNRSSMRAVVYDRQCFEQGKAQRRLKAR